MSGMEDSVKAVCPAFDEAFENVRGDKRPDPMQLFRLAYSPSRRLPGDDATSDVHQALNIS